MPAAAARVVFLALLQRSTKNKEINGLSANKLPPSRSLTYHA